MPSHISTSPEAYGLAVKLCEDYERRKQKEKELNLKKAADPKKPAIDSIPEDEKPSRVITEIDYSKHEKTVKELDRQEKEEEFARKKEEASQWCTLDHEHGPNCRRPVGGCSHDHQKEWAIYEKSTEEKIGAADRFRQEGNEAYKKHNYGLAAVHYRKALLQFDYTFAETEEEEKAADDVKTRCLLNLAACKCQQEEWDEVLTQCRLVLEINPRSVKAFYRTGLAHLARDQFDLATESLRSAHELEPQNPEVLAALRQLKKNMAKYKVRRKEVFKEMMVGSTDGNGEGGEPVLEHESANVAGDSLNNENTTVGKPAKVVDLVDDCQHTGDSQPAEGDVHVNPISNDLADMSKKSEGSPHVEDNTDSTRKFDDSPCSVGKQNSGVVRQRHVVPSTVRANQDEGATDEDEDKLSIPQSRLLNCILFLAVCLGTVSVVVCVIASFYPIDR